MAVGRSVEMLSPLLEVARGEVADHGTDGRKAG
jgi:hypothetical protein